MTKNLLTDLYGRSVDYIRVSVTDRCDLRCTYCMPRSYRDFQPPENWLTVDELQRVIHAFASLGTKRVRITGGEPLTRSDIVDISASLSSIDNLEDLSLSTNGVKLNKLAQPLHDAGVSRINVSLDTLNTQRFYDITRGKLDKVLTGLQIAKQAGFEPVKINMVVMKGINDDEISDMVEYCQQNNFVLRFIETMPIGQCGREASEQYVNLQTVRENLSQRYQLIPDIMPGGGPARYVRVQGSDLKIGFITPISQHFCETCNRVRLSAEGTLYMCLGQNHRFELRPLLRSGISESGLQEAIVEAIKLKPEKHEFLDKPQQVVRFMSMTGG